MVDVDVRQVGKECTGKVGVGVLALMDVHKQSLIGVGGIGGLVVGG